MSVVVEEFPPQASRKYPWEKWADGRIHELTRGEDFDVAPLAISRAAMRWCEYSGYRVQTRVRGNKCWLQFKPRRHQLRSVG